MKTSKFLKWIDCWDIETHWFIFFFKINLSFLRSQQSCNDSCPECGFCWALPTEGLHRSRHRSGFCPPRLFPVGLCRWSRQPDGLAAHLHWKQDTVSWHVGEKECVGGETGLSVSVEWLLLLVFALFFFRVGAKNHPQQPKLCLWYHSLISHSKHRIKLVNKWSFLLFSLTHSPYSDQVVVHVRRPEDTPLNSHRRLIWCPYIQDDNEENQDDTSQTLALLHEDRVLVFCTESLLKTQFL